MENPEIILNLWYVSDEEGVIYSLRARAYLGTGSDAEKLAFLQQFAKTDYLIARSFPIPEDFRIEGLPISHKSMLELPGSSIALFAQAIQTLEDELPEQTPYEIPDQALICITPLLKDHAGNLQPFFSGQKFL